MKTRNLLISGFLTLIFVLGVVFFISCKKENNEQPVPKDENYAFQNAGRLHNGALAYYYQNRLKLKATSSSEEIYSEIIDLTSEYLVNQGFDRGIVVGVTSRVKNSMGSLGLKSTSGNFYSIDTASFIRQIDGLKMFSNEFVSNVNKLFALAHDDVSEDVIKDYVNNTFAKINYLNQNDVNAQKVYVDIFNSSFNYWLQSDGDNAEKKAKLKPSTWVIINDGIGGVLGSAFGPIGSVALGTVLSAGTNEEIKN